MKGVFKNWRSFLNEASLSRVYKFVVATDTAMLTGFRNNPSDMSKCLDSAHPSEVRSADQAAGEAASKGAILSANKLRNRDLKATLLSLKYGVTKVDGNYIEDFGTADAVEVGEDSLFVVNLEQDPNFVQQIISIGKKFCQDSVLIIPPGGQDAYVYGTNNTSYPGLDQTTIVGSLKLGHEGEFMTRVGNRPLTFTEGLETYKGLSRQERMAVKSLAKVFLD
jgi:hypothetical protein